MPGPYSLDLRKRIVGSHQQGVPCRQVGDVYGVSPSCAVKLVAHQRRTGTLEPDTLGRQQGSGKLEPCRDFMIAIVMAQPDITMPELVARLEDMHAVVAHPASLSRFLRNAGFTYKKNADRIRTSTQRCREKTS